MKDNYSWLDDVVLKPAKWQYDDYKIAKQTIISQIEIEKLRARIEAYKIAILGICPECNQEVKDWVAPSGMFAPEMWETLRENNINATTGHKNNCDLQEKLK